MFSEIVHGLVTRVQTDNGVDQNQPDAELVPCSLRIGIIPAGKTLICFTCFRIIVIIRKNKIKDEINTDHNNISIVNTYNKL